ncbi:MAG: phosphate ABC transporter permease subunit PstC [candidate division KSB1 bacterium]|nr:phosphate ABC transporter permease subunit PstC [candidate division KSB1 bacterium]
MDYTITQGFDPCLTKIQTTKHRRCLWDRISGRCMFVITLFSGMIVFIMALALLYRSLPILKSVPLSELLTSSSWHPMRGEFGFLPFILGTMWVTGVAILIAAPFSILAAIYLSEYAPGKIRNFASPLIDILAGIPSVVYGIWGILVIVPFVKDHVAPLCGTFSTGYSVLAGGIVLSIMVLPVIIHVTIEVLSTVPVALKEASLALGATQWQTTKHVVLRKSLPGVIAAIVLGLSRAFGETMAVLMVAGNVARNPSSLLDPAYPLPALIANNYGEMMSVPLYDSALLLASLILLLIVLIFNIISRFILMRIERRVI